MIEIKSAIQNDETVFVVGTQEKEKRVFIEKKHFMIALAIVMNCGRATSALANKIKIIKAIRRVFLASYGESPNSLLLAKQSMEAAYSYCAGFGWYYQDIEAALANDEVQMV
jgi:hypothetical protein